jgi:hypothetical protein
MCQVADQKKNISLGTCIKAKPTSAAATMTITVQSLTGVTYNLPYYMNMRVGQYVTQVAAPAVGCEVRASGDVFDQFVLDGALVFTKENKDKYLAEVMEDGATLFHSMRLGRCMEGESPVGNGSRMPPTQYQLTLWPSVFGSLSKKRKV